MCIIHISGRFSIGLFYIFTVRVAAYTHTHAHMCIYIYEIEYRKALYLRCKIIKYLINFEIKFINPGAHLNSITVQKKKKLSKKSLLCKILFLYFTPDVINF